MFHIIDDDDVIREMIKIIISEAGYSVFCFNSAEAYLEHLYSPEFEMPIAVLSDLTMPGMNGYELALQVRKVHSRLKILMITGNAGFDYNQRASHQLCSRLDKPFHPETLVALLSSLDQCENAAGAEGAREFDQQCEFAVGEQCPFHQANQLE